MTSKPDTVALLTPPRPGAIAVIALAGPNAVALAQRVAQPNNAHKTDTPPVGKTIRVSFAIANTEIDDGLMLVRAVSDGQSFVELHTHGSSRVVQRIVAALQAAGAVFVNPNAKDAPPLAGVDPIASLLQRARTRRSVRYILDQADRWPAAVDAVLDDLNAGRTPDAIATLHEWLAARSMAGYMIDGLTVALIGPPNAGKSTLANRILGRDHLIATEEPGTTRDHAAEPAAIDGMPVTLIDTAGRRIAEDPLEHESIARGRAAASAADLRLLLLDRSAAPPPDLDELLAAPPPLVRVLNKCDLPPHAQAAARVTARNDELWIEISASRGDGLDALFAAVRSAAGLTDAALAHVCPITDRRAAAVQQAVAALQAGRLEVAAFALRSVRNRPARPNEDPR